VRLVFVDERAQRCIKATLKDRIGDHEPALFVNFRPGADAHTGGRLTPRGVQLMFGDVTERAGLAGLGIVPHSMRHGLAVDLLKGGADLRVVQDVLGHATIVTTQVYTKIENSHLEEGYRKRKSLQKPA
jgi:integrase/recombinase XerD